MKNNNKKVWIAAALGILMTAGVASIWIPLPVEDFNHHSVQSLRIVDRNGVVLREFLNDQQGRGEWKPLSAIAPSLQQATIAVEDRRFFLHPGVDPVAIARAMIDNIKAMRVVSGGSTITQQVIRNAYRHPRTFWYKCAEIWQALRLERMYSKQEILEQYLNRAPYGNQFYGVEAASRAYFGKPAEKLSLAESAFLSALPNAPSTLNPKKNKEAALSRQQGILRRLRDQQIIGEGEYQRAAVQPVQLIPGSVQFKAPHVASMIETMNPPSDNGTVRTAVDYPLQERIQSLMAGHLRTLIRRNVHNAAVVVLENRTGEIRALAGTVNFFDTLHNGQVNGVTAPRQPGSAIKPFMYCLAFEQGISPATLIADIPTALPDHHGDYVPENYDKRFHGPVRLRTALACSYNVPAVRTLQTVGKAALLEKLKDAGFSSLDQDAEFYGYGLTLGNAEVTLLQLTTGYMAFANGGVWMPATLLPAGILPQPAHRIYQEGAAYLITSILKDRAARRPAFGGNFHFPFECAVKTGTTKDYKDNWTIGYTTRYTVGVWVGNFNGETMRAVSGVSGAGPIFTDVMTLLHSAPYGAPPPDFAVPDSCVRQIVCARSGKIPTALCNKTIDEWFLRGNTPQEECTIHREYEMSGFNGIGQKRIYEIFPVEYAAWAANEKIPVPPPDARRIARKGRDDGQPRRLMIVSPAAGDYFKIDPVLRTEYQIITITGFVPPEVSNVTLSIDGERKVPFDIGGARWQLQKGIHRFELQGEKGTTPVASAPVCITVE